jgi:hypothetical protein
MLFLMIKREGLILIHDGGSENEGWNHDESLDVENGAERCKTYHC